MRVGGKLFTAFIYLEEKYNLNSYVVGKMCTACNINVVCFDSRN